MLFLTYSSRTEKNKWSYNCILFRSSDKQAFFNVDLKPKKQKSNFGSGHSLIVSKFKLINVIEVFRFFCEG